MWGRLAQDLDLNSTLKKLGNAVAPPAGSDGEYDDDDGEYYDEDEEGEYYDDDEDIEGEEEGDGRPGLGLVGLLARALDDRPKDDDNEDYDDGEFEDEPLDDVDVDDDDDQNHVSAPTSNNNINSITAEDNSSNNDVQQVVEPKMQVPTPPASSSSQQREAARQLRSQEMEERKRQRQERIQQRELERHKLEEEAANIQQQEQDRLQREEEGIRRMDAERQHQAEMEATLKEEAEASRLRAMQGEEEQRQQEEARLQHEEQERQRIQQQQQQQAEMEAEASRLQAQQVEEEQRQQQEEEEAMRLAQVEAEAQRLREEQQKEQAEHAQQEAFEHQQQQSQFEMEATARRHAEEEAAQLRAELESLKQTHADADSKLQNLSSELQENNLQQAALQQNFEQEKSKFRETKEALSKEKELLEEQLAAERQEKEQVIRDSVKNESTALDADTNGSSQDPARVQELERHCAELEEQLKLMNVKANEETADTTGSNTELWERCQVLQEKLAAAEEVATETQRAAEEQVAKVASEREKQLMEFQAKEARLMEATTEDHEHEIMEIKENMLSKIHELEEKAAEDRKTVVLEQQEYKQRLDETEKRAEIAEVQLQKLVKNHEKALVQSRKQEQLELGMMEEKMAQTLALLDEREDEVSHLKAVVQNLQSTMHEHKEGVEEADQEIDELHVENEDLQKHVDELEKECSDLRTKLGISEVDSERAGALQMELTMLREELNRERSKNQSVVQSALSTQSQVELERDEAVAAVRDLKQQVAAAMADLEIAKADCERITTSNTNLQSALEAFQDEREAEMRLNEDHRLESEEGIKAAHAASLEAVRQTHKAEIRQIQSAADLAVKNSMNEIALLEGKIENLKTEGLQTRRSLDEAIHRLQTSQEDVIDRTLMKNVLVDWCTMKDKAKRHQVLELMASVLHFTEEEREKVHLTHLYIESVRNRIVGAVAAPLPEAKADIQHLQGENVREKWVNFLLAETDDGP